MPAEGVSSPLSRLFGFRRCHPALFAVVGALVCSSGSQSYSGQLLARLNAGRPDGIDLDQWRNGVNRQAVLLLSLLQNPSRLALNHVSLHPNPL